MRPLSPAEAYARATARCAAAEQCTADWRRKFATFGLERADANALLDRLVDEGFIDDARYARAYVHDKVHYDHWGPLKVRAALAAKGIAAADINAALDLIPTETWRTNLRTALEAKARALGLSEDTNIEDEDADSEGEDADYDNEDAAGRNDFVARRAAQQKLMRFAASRGYEPAEILRALDE